MNAEQRARELLAAYFEENGSPWTASLVRQGASFELASSDALRAITRALTRPAPTEAEVEAAVARMADIPMGDVTAGECMTRAELTSLARAALGVGDD